MVTSSFAKCYNPPFGKAILAHLGRFVNTGRGIYAVFRDLPANISNSQREHFCVKRELIQLDKLIRRVHMVVFSQELRTEGNAALDFVDIGSAADGYAFALSPVRSS